MQIKIKPFIIPNESVILYKSAPNSDEEPCYFYFKANQELNFRTETDFEDTLTISYCQLFPRRKTTHNRNDEYVSTQSTSDITGIYNRYSITINRFEDELSSILSNNADKMELDIQIVPTGVGIGSIILHHLIYYGKEKYPYAAVPKIKISWIDEEDPENKARRDRLYVKLGLLDKTNKMLNQLFPIIENRGYEVIQTQDFITELLADKSDVNYQIRALTRALNVQSEQINNLESTFLRRFYNIIDSFIGTILYLPYNIYHYLKKLLNFILRK